MGCFITFYHLAVPAVADVDLTLTNTSWQVNLQRWGVQTFRSIQFIYEVPIQSSSDQIQATQLSTGPIQTQQQTICQYNTTKRFILLQNVN